MDLIDLDLDLDLIYPSLTLGPNMAPLFLSIFFICFSNIFSLLWGIWFTLLWGTLGSLYSLFRRVLIYFVILKLCSFYTLCIAAASIYNCRGGGILASFLSSTVAVYLYLPILRIIIKKRTI